MEELDIPKAGVARKVLREASVYLSRARDVARAIEKETNWIESVLTGAERQAATIGLISGAENYVNKTRSQLPVDDDRPLPDDLKHKVRSCIRQAQTALQRLDSILKGTRSESTLAEQFAASLSKIIDKVVGSSVGAASSIVAGAASGVGKGLARGLGVVGVLVVLLVAGGILYVRFK